RGATEEHRLLLPGCDRLLDPLLRTAQVGQVIDVLGKLSHGPPGQPILCAARVQASAHQPIRGCTVGHLLTLLTPAVVAAVTAWWAVLQARGVQLGHLAGGAMPYPHPHPLPRPRPPAAHLIPPRPTPASRQSHRPLLPGPGGPSSPPWLATAGLAPPPTARCRAPDTARQRGCRTAARSCGRPDSAHSPCAGGAG